MKRKFMIMNEFNPEASGGAGAGNEPTGQADGAINTANVDSGNQPSADSGNQAPENKPAFSIDSLPAEAQDIIKNLRAENAKYRTEKNNVTTRLENIENGFKQMFGGEGEGQELTPEQQIEQLQGSYEQMSFQNALLGLAYENSIPMDNYEYFNFLMDKEVNGLEEGQELSEESLLEVIQKAKGFNQSMDNANTSVDGQGNENPNQNSGSITLEQFTKMNISEKSELYRKSPAVYNQYMKQAKENRLL
jgi:hypothetical protein